MTTIFTNQATLNYNGDLIRSNITQGSIESVLSINKEVVETSYHAGETLTYVVSIVNRSDNAMTGVTVSDDLGAYPFDAQTIRPLSYKQNSLQYYANGVLQTDPAVSSTDGLVISGISVPANSSAILVYSATVNEYAPLDTDGEIINTVTLQNAKSSSAQTSNTVPVTGEALLSVLKSVTPVPVSENGELTYTFQLQNSGNTPITEADSAVITDTFTPTLSNIRVVFNGQTLVQGTDYTYDESTGEFATVNGALSIPAATFTQDTTTGEWHITPGVSTLTITGVVNAIC